MPADDVLHRAGGRTHSQDANTRGSDG